MESSRHVIENQKQTSSIISETALARERRPRHTTTTRADTTAPAQVSKLRAEWNTPMRFRPPIRGGELIKRVNRVPLRHRREAQHILSAPDLVASLIDAEPCLTAEELYVLLRALP